MTTWNARKDVKDLGHSYDIAGGYVEWHNHSGKQYGSFLKN